MATHKSSLGYSVVCDSRHSRTEEEIQSILDENARLRQIICDCAAALGNGAMILPQASIEFMELLPREISLVIARKKG